MSLDYGPYDSGLNLKRALVVGYVEYGLGLPRVLVTIVREYPSAMVLLVAGVTGVLVFGYLYRAASEAGDLPDRTRALGLGAVGLGVFGLGYSIFLGTSAVTFTPSGVGNRTAIAAVTGIALSFVAGAAWLASFAPRGRWRRAVLCGLVALVCSGGFTVVSTLASFWIAASRAQHAILADIREQVPALPPGATLILDGVCQYEGPRSSSRPGGISQGRWRSRTAIRRSRRTS